MSLDFLYTAVSWMLLRWHQLFTAIGLPPDGGGNWSLSIVLLVVTVRLLPLLFKRQSAGGLAWLAQIPIFLAVYHVLRHVANSANLLGPSPQLSLYSFTPRETLSAAHATLFGAPLSGTAQLGTLLPMVTVVLVSAAAAYLTQRLIRRTQPAEPGTPAATVQQLMLYVGPAGVLISGLIFPLGVLLYWLTSNVVTLVLQLYVHRAPRRRAAARG